MTKEDDNSKEQNVSVIIPNYNGKELLKNNLPQVIKASTNKRNKIKEIIVVDDASSDDSVSYIKSKFSQVRLIKHTKHRWFAAAVNMGARSSKGKLLALLNNDVSPSKNFLQSILPHFKDDNVFAVSMNEQGYSFTKGEFKDGFITYKEAFKSKKAHESFWANGGSAVFRRDYWMKLNGMDEKLLSPFYWEDNDISYRAMKRGWKIIWEPKSKVVHHHESTISKFPKRYKETIQERNQLIFIWKNLTSPILFRKHISGLLKRISTHPGYLRIVLLALFRLPKIRKARKKEKRESKVSDEAIFARFS
jgi:GT2 family glycosyltransferase